MSLIQHLRLTAHKGLKQAILTDLGQINVLCGPNGGGKTTVLECIADSTHRIIGVRLSGEDITAMTQEVVAAINWGHSVNAQRFSAAVATAMPSDQLWYPDNFAAVWLNVSSEFVRLAHANLSANIAGHLERAFKARFPTVPSIALIPAKRKLDAYTTISTGEVVRPAGDGILNFLFLAKNKDLSSPLRKKYEEVRKAFEAITDGCSFDVTLRDTNNQIELRLQMPGTSWLFADDCGLGYRDILTILYFSLASDEALILIEEPENHLHPDIQRKLFSYLKRHSPKQFFLSTHSSVFLDTKIAARVYSCRLLDSVKVENSTSRAQLLTELGYSIADNIVSDLIVLCEGPKDRLVLDEFFQKLGYTDRYRIKVWPLGGDIMGQLDLSVFGENHRPIALVDTDPASSKVRKKFIANCDAQGIRVHQLKRYALENYFPLSAIKAAIPDHGLSDALVALKPDLKVSDQLGFDVKGNSKKIAELMSLEDVNGTDFADFLGEVGKLCESNKSK